MQPDLTTALSAARNRLQRQGLGGASDAGLSVRAADMPRMLWLEGSAEAPVVCALSGSDAVLAPGTAGLTPGAALHAAVYRLRPDVGAVLTGGGAFSRELAQLGGAMPQLFDEQARHLGPMHAPAPELTDAALEAALAAGANALLVGGIPVCLGTSCQRLVFNAELFEKCAQAWVLAAATGGRVSRLPRWVCWIANGRLRRDQRRAAHRFGQGLFPEEVRGY